MSIEHMDDEEFDNLVNDGIVSSEVASDETEAVEETTVADEPADEVAETDTEDQEVQDTESDSEESDETEEVEGDDESLTDEPEASTDDNVETEDENQDFDYEATYNEVMKPLTVSGKEVKVKSIDDLRNLASMGIDYSRKMRDIKPLRAVGAALSEAQIINNGVVDEQKLQLMIDISKGNKDALAEFMKASGIDPMDIDTEEAQYTPTTHIPSNADVELTEITEQINRTGMGDQVANAVGSMDDNSKVFFRENPKALLTLTNDISNGIFEKVMGEIQYERQLGRIPDSTSDIEAYIQLIGAHTQPQGAQQAQTPPAKPTAKKPSAKKRRAAGVTNRGPVKQTKAYDFVNMSDEEFEKMTLGLNY